MTKPLSMLMIAAVVPLVGGALFLTVPMLRSNESAMNAEVGEHVERARRLLVAYGGNQERLAEVLAHLEAEGVDIELQGAGAERVLEDNRDVVDDANAVLAELARSPAANKLKSMEARYAEMGGDAEAPIMETGGLGRNISAMIRSARQGIQARQRILQENGRLLADALSAVELALAVAHGDASGAQHVDANRIKGTILVAQAAELHRGALRARGRRDAVAAQLSAMVREAGRLAIERNLVERSNVRDQLDALNDEADVARRSVEAQEGDIGRLESTISDLDRRVAALREEAGAARAAMETLEEEGADLLDPRGAEVFADRYAALSDAYRAAAAEANRLEFGTLIGARIDDSGDYVHGAFVPDTPGGHITEQRGLADYRHDLETAVVDLAGAMDSVTGLAERIEDLTALAEKFAGRSAEAMAALDGVRQRGRETYASFEEIVAEADEVFDQAARKARAAVQAFRVSGGSAATRSRDAGDRVAALSPTIRDRSPFKHVSEDRWAAGQVNNEAGQAHYALGSIHFARFVAARADHELVLVAKAGLELSGADAGPLAERRDTTRDDGIDALRSAAASFEKSFRDLNSNWSIPAETAAAHYLLSLLEHPDHLQTAIENYQKAADNVPEHPSAQPILDRLDQLKNR